jgi:hypothetical protein
MPVGEARVSYQGPCQKVRGLEQFNRRVWSLTPIFCRYGKNRHVPAQPKVTMVCSLRSGVGSPSEKAFNLADVFKRHMMSVHVVEQSRAVAGNSYQHVQPARRPESHRCPRIQAQASTMGLPSSGASQSIEGTICTSVTLSRRAPSGFRPDDSLRPPLLGVDKVVRVRLRCQWLVYQVTLSGQRAVT